MGGENILEEKRTEIAAMEAEIKELESQWTEVSDELNLNLSRAKRQFDEKRIEIEQKQEKIDFYESNYSRLVQELKQEMSRREYLIEEYKIKHGLDQLDFFVPQVEIPATYNLRSNNQRLRSQLVRSCEARQQFFTNRVTSLWNSLPQEAVDAETLNRFKGHLVDLGYACEPSQGFRYCQHRQNREP